MKSGMTYVTILVMSTSFRLLFLISQFTFDYIVYLLKIVVAIVIFNAFVL